MTANKPAYVLVDTKITDPVAYEDYKAAAKPIAEQYGGVYLTRGGKMDTMQTELWDPARIVLVKFPSMAAAHAFLESPEPPCKISPCLLPRLRPRPPRGTSCSGSWRDELLRPSAPWSTSRTATPPQ